MFKKVTKNHNMTHTFTSEQEFLMQPDWILKTKGREVFDAWVKLDTEADRMHPDYNELYEEWIAFYSITHEVVKDE
jgi:hypothetical protein